MATKITKNDIILKIIMPYKKNSGSQCNLWETRQLYALLNGIDDKENLSELNCLNLVRFFMSKSIQRGSPSFYALAELCKIIASDSRMESTLTFGSENGSFLSYLIELKYVLYYFLEHNLESLAQTYLYQIIAGSQYSNPYEYHITAIHLEELNAIFTILKDKKLDNETNIAAILSFIVKNRFGTNSIRLTLRCLDRDGLLTPENFTRLTNNDIGLAYLFTHFSHNVFWNFLPCRLTQTSLDDVIREIGGYCKNSNDDNTRGIWNRVARSLMGFIKCNFSKDEIVKNARLLAQGRRTSGCLFSRLPDELLMLIAAQTRIPVQQTQVDALKLARRNLGRPPGKI